MDWNAIGKFWLSVVTMPAWLPMVAVIWLNAVIEKKD